MRSCFVFFFTTFFIASTALHAADPLLPSLLSLSEQKAVVDILEEQAEWLEPFVSEKTFPLSEVVRGLEFSRFELKRYFNVKTKMLENQLKLKLKYLTDAKRYDRDYTEILSQTKALFLASYILFRTEDILFTSRISRNLKHAALEAAIYGVGIAASGTLESELGIPTEITKTTLVLALGIHSGRYSIKTLSDYFGLKPVHQHLKENAEAIQKHSLREWNSFLVRVFNDRSPQDVLQNIFHFSNEVCEEVLSKKSTSKASYQTLLHQSSEIKLNNNETRSTFYIDLSKIKSAKVDSPTEKQPESLQPHFMQEAVQATENFAGEEILIERKRL